MSVEEPSQCNSVLRLQVLKPVLLWLVSGVAYGQVLAATNGYGKWRVVKDHQEIMSDDEEEDPYVEELQETEEKVCTRRL